MLKLESVQYIATAADSKTMQYRKLLVPAATVMLVSCVVFNLMRHIISSQPCAHALEHLHFHYYVIGSHFEQKLLQQ